ncbi:DNA-binding MarR family transcriptional regulator [Azospirillum lipoferum]|uniref:MarR family transcriptional regulator n=1 Tax=Azospirillum lipoferum TaxID=193 RepID=A0A5A9GTR5_AZOLI|nr:MULTISPECIES: MarR family transcriptional regulator [Azospirillum]KAA0597225.1 MarR family transcriptional regulator [Azospirillum lipoferum]MCP1608737.1 DNA-binding MarR family transcriptional regulator [Azospirillum lipoferum]MDW5535945.1 MarR family transcriptional regulator [Azospirillum sp. NL1]
MAADKDDPLLLSNQACFALYSANLAMSRVYRPMLEKLGLTYPQYLIMLLLWEEDGQSMKLLGERLGLDSGTLTPLLKRMEGQRLVTRSRDPQDERLVRIGLTAEGAALRAQAECLPTHIAAAAGSSAGELMSLREALLRLRDDLNRAADQN